MLLAVIFTLFHAPLLSQAMPLSDFEQFENVPCAVDDIAKNIQQFRPTVPHKLYHYGEKKFMLEDIAAKNVPLAAWENYIRGSNGRYRLNPSRRGLYGTVGVESNGFGGGTYNWLMEIEIADRCIEPVHVMTVKGLEKDRRFLAWYQKSSAKLSYTLSQFIETCYPGGIPALGYTGFIAGECDLIVNQFMDASGITVVQDTIIQKAFYIRDRSCIVNIRGTGDDWLEILTSQKYLWSQKCGSNNSSTIPSLLLAALSESKRPIIKSAIEDAVEWSRNKFSFSSATLDELFEAKKRCFDQKKLNDFTQLMQPIADQGIAAYYSSVDHAAVNSLCR